MLFIKNKYSKIYFSIINKAKKEKRNRNKKIIYEKHHIIPKSFKLLKNIDYKNNLVLLTPKEHYICHLLLTKMPKNKLFKYKMNNAFRIMQTCSKFNNYRVSSKFYKSRKIKYSENHQKLENNSNYNKKWIKNDCLEIQIKIHKDMCSRIVLRSNSKNWSYGRKMTYKNKTKLFNKISKRILKFNIILKEKTKKYTPIFKKWKKSNLTIRAFAKNYGYNHTSLYKNFRQLKYID